MRQLHTIPPVYDARSRVLILGSFPSVASRGEGFFYGHPQNRFWRVMAALLGCETPQSVPEKRAMLLSGGVALWDVVASCEINGSSDASIRTPAANDLAPILAQADIRRIFTAGGTADGLYRKLIYPVTGIQAQRLPSTSPANAAFSLERLCSEWSAILRYL